MKNTYKDNRWESPLKLLFVSKDTNEFCLIFSNYPKCSLLLAQKHSLIYMKYLQY